MKLKRLDTPEGRYYLHEAGENPRLDDGTLLIMPSVTTILSQLESLRLKELENSMGSEALLKLGDKAAKRGTAMHAFLENYCICLQRGGTEETCLLYTQKKTLIDLRLEGHLEENIVKGRELFYNYIHEGYLERIQKVIFTEKFTWSLKHKYAGTLDFCFWNTENQLVIADFKSANGLKDEETIHKYFLQLSAYTLAFEEIYNKKVDHAELWISNPNGIQERILKGIELKEVKEEFIQLSEKYHRNWNAKDIISKYYST